jgi:hypothetical protein
LEFAIEPASIVFVTVPVSPVVTTVPVVAGNVIVLVPAEEGTAKVIVPELEPARETEPVVGTVIDPTKVVAVICAAEKLPEPSLATIVLIVLVDAEFFHLISQHLNQNQFHQL